MAIMKFDPVRGFENLAARLNEIVGDFDKGLSFDIGSFQPRVDISEDDKKLYLIAEVPGINKEDVKVTINEDNILVIRGEKKRDLWTEGENKSFMRVERSFGEFNRSFMLPDNVNRDSIQAKCENGLLNIVLDKKEPEKPREIQINIV